MRAGLRTMCLMALCAATLSCGSSSAAEITGKVSAPLIGDLVAAETERKLGLVKINAGGGFCSGVQVNQFWVLTASHCITTVDPSTIQVRADWAKGTAIPTRIVRKTSVGKENWSNRGIDLILLFLGNGDLGWKGANSFSAGAPVKGEEVDSYGAGGRGFGMAGPPPQPAPPLDFRYRTARFTMSAVGGTTYTLIPNESSQAMLGGDSGGPDFIANGGTQILGVHSTCRATHVPGQPRNWSWATAIRSCNSARVDIVWDELSKAVRPQKVAFCRDYAAKVVATAMDNQRLKCGLTGAAWSLDRADHLDACMLNMIVKENERPLTQEIATRQRRIDECRPFKKAPRGDVVAANPSYQNNFDMPGSDYRSFETTKAADAECSVACSKDANCKAWTWVRPGIQAPKGKCWLKNSVPAAVANECCISGLFSKVIRAGGKTSSSDVLVPEQSDGPSPFGDQQKPFETEADIDVTRPSGIKTAPRPGTNFGGGGGGDPR